MRIGALFEKPTAVNSWQAADLAAVVLWLQARFPACRFIDATFPEQRLSFVLPGYRWLLPQGGLGVPDFLAGFRNAAPEGSGRAISELTGDARGTHVVFLAQGRVPELLAAARRAVMPLLVRLDDLGAAAGLAAMARAQGWQAVRFARTKGDLVSYLCLLPHAEEVGEPTLPWRVEPLPPCPPVSGAAIAPDALMTDCPWPSEGSEDFPWLWLGPQILTRICLGDPPAEFRSLTIQFMDHPQHADLANNLVFQLNGRPVPFDGAGLRPTGGGARIRLDPALSRPLVLGIGAFPAVSRLPGEPRHLRASLIRLEFTA